MQKVARFLGWLSPRTPSRGLTSIVSNAFAAVAAVVIWDVPPKLTVLNRDHNRGYYTPYEGLLVTVSMISWHSPKLPYCTFFYPHPRSWSESPRYPEHVALSRSAQPRCSTRTRCGTRSPPRAMRERSSLAFVNPQTLSFFWRLRAGKRDEGSKT